MADLACNFLIAKNLLNFIKVTFKGVHADSPLRLVGVISRVIRVVKTVSQSFRPLGAEIQHCWPELRKQSCDLDIADLDKMNQSSLGISVPCRDFPLFYLKGTLYIRERVEALCHTEKNIWERGWRKNDYNAWLRTRIVLIFWQYHNQCRRKSPFYFWVLAIKRNKVSARSKKWPAKRREPNKLCVF